MIFTYSFNGNIAVSARDADEAEEKVNSVLEEANVDSSNLQIVDQQPDYYEDTKGESKL